MGSQIHLYSELPASMELYKDTAKADVARHNPRPGDLILAGGSSIRAPSRVAFPPHVERHVGRNTCCVISSDGWSSGPFSCHNSILGQGGNL